jgi:energy-converting hydrogenase B subunit Q
MPRRSPQPIPSAVAVHLEVRDEPGAVASIAAAVGSAGGRVRTLSTVRRAPASEVVEAVDDGKPTVELELEVEEADEAALISVLEPIRDVLAMRLTRPLGKVFGKRVIVVGGGAQVAQVALGAVSEADRHNLRGERISVDTIPLVGEEPIASAVRAVADLPRARMLVLAGSIMGGEISRAADELRAVGIPIIALNMVGSITDHVDLVVSDPVQAGTMAVMAISDTATFDLGRQRGRRY